MDARTPYRDLWTQVDAILARAAARGRELGYEELVAVDRLERGIDLLAGQLLGQQSLCRACDRPLAK